MTQKTDDVFTLTKKIVSIPSYVDGTQNENELVAYLEQYCANNFPNMTVERQPTSDGRANLLLKGKGDITLFTLGHIDTVQPKTGWLTNPLQPTVKDSKLYGLGAADMKGSLAAFLCALKEIQQKVSLDNLLLLMYIDEEYSFTGMNTFVDSPYIKELQPELILSLDGSLELASGCRGLIGKVGATLKGKSGHASNPANGINAITNTMAALARLEQKIAEYTDEYLGKSTLNVAYLQGGCQSESGEWQQEGNVIADTAEVLFEIRTASRKLDGDKAIELFTQYANEQGLAVSNVKNSHDLAPWPVAYDSPARQKLEAAYRAAGATPQLSDRTFSGFIDVQMITEKVTAPTFIIGTGGENKHGANEAVPLKNLATAQKIYQEVITQYLGEKQ